MIFEACASGLPMVLMLPMPGQERATVDFLVNYGAALLARTPTDVVDKVRFLATHARRMEQMSESANLVGKGRASQTICERVLAAIR
jgi:processive 1,2-diacylglycerol beta-glucosyltransferase